MIMMLPTATHRLPLVAHGCTHTRNVLRTLSVPAGLFFRGLTFDP